MNSKSSAIIIGNYVVSKFMDNSIRIKPLNWHLQNEEPVVTEHKVEVDNILKKLVDGKITYDELVKCYF